MSNRATGIVTYTETGRPQVGNDPWPLEVRELAFELWAFQFQRNASDTARALNLLAQDHEDTNTYNVPGVVIEALQEREMPAKTIANWASSKKWEVMRSERMRELAPAMHRIVEDELRILSLEAVKQQKALLLDSETPAVVKAKLIDSILDRTGHQPFIRPKDDSKPRGPETDYEGVAAGMTIEEIRQSLFSDFDIQPKE